MLQQIGAQNFLDILTNEAKYNNNDRQALCVVTVASDNYRDSKNWDCCTYC